MVKYWTRERHRYIVILIPFPALRTKETNAGAADHPESAPGKQFEAVTGSSLQDYTDEHRFSQGELTSSSSPRTSSVWLFFIRLNRDLLKWRGGWEGMLLDWEIFTIGLRLLGVQN